MFLDCVIGRRDMVETDYCGLKTGKKVDKAALFDIFYGELKTAPMIRQCPVNMELRLRDVLDFETHDIFLGELVQTYADDKVLTNGKIDVSKLRPLLFDMASVKYWRLGVAVGNCWNVGKSLKRQPA
jgi:flavin reductase (DIM6/NTAB) family NADH-FMN oxidoreductase RutF